MGIREELARLMGPTPAGRVVSMSGGGGGGRAYNPNNMATWGAGGGDTAAMMAQMQAAQQQQNQAALQQYKRLLGSVKATQKRTGKLFGKAQKMTKDMGRSAIEDTEMARTQRLAGAEQDLISRGLGNTTIRGSMQRGINADADRNIRAIREGVNAQRSGLFAQQAGAQMGLGQFRADSLLSRQNVNPFQADYIQMLQQLAASGG